MRAGYKTGSEMRLGVCPSPPSPFGLWRGSLHSLRYERLPEACPAEAREASEGWWSQAGSNRRPLACHASALPAELWPLTPSARLSNARAETLNTVQGLSQVSSSPPT